MIWFILGFIIGLLVGWAIPRPEIVRDYEDRFFRWWKTDNRTMDDIRTDDIRTPNNETVIITPVANNAPNT